MIQNTLFMIQNTLFVIQNTLFIIKNALFVTQNILFDSQMTQYTFFYSRKIITYALGVYDPGSAPHGGASSEI